MIARSSQKNSSFLELLGKLKTTWTADPLGWSFSMRTKLNWSWYETFLEFENVLTGSYKTVWREVVKDHFSVVLYDIS
jgi:hypothetical protein